jgi:hypothetical protein
LISTTCTRFGAPFWNALSPTENACAGYSRPIANTWRNTTRGVKVAKEMTGSNTGHFYLVQNADISTLVGQAVSKGLEVTVASA